MQRRTAPSSRARIRYLMMAPRPVPARHVRADECAGRARPRPKPSNNEEIVYVLKAGCAIQSTGDA